MNRDNGHNPSRGRSSADRDGKNVIKRERIKILSGDKKPLFSSNANRSTNYDKKRNVSSNSNSERFNDRNNDTYKSYSNRGEGNKEYRPSNNRYNNSESNNRYGNSGYSNNRYNNSESNYNRYDSSATSNNRYNNNSDSNNRHGNSGYGSRYNNSGSNNNRYPERNERNGNGERYQNRNNNFGARPQGNFKPRSNDYDPNAKYSHKKQMEYKRKDIDPTKPVRLNKFLANAGICSRREADEYIQAGVITVNGEIVTEMGAKVMLTDKVMFHDQPIRSERKIYLLLNKPKNCVTTTEDTHERTTVMDLVKNACSERVYPVGRLDRNTTGVLLLTNDGDLAARLTHPKHHKKKIYHATLDKPLEQEDYDKIMTGIKLDEENTIKPDALEYIKEGDNKQLGIEIHSGQNRVVRRIFENVGYKVVRLDRVFFAGLTKKNLARGKYRILNQREINMLLMGAFE